MTMCEAFELRYVDPASNSNKFYRIYVTDDGRIVYQWGRVGSVGQWKHTGAASKRAAWDMADRQAHTKEMKGYERTGNPVSFDVPANIITNLPAHETWLDGQYRSAGGNANAPSNSEADKRLAAREEAQDEKFKATLLKLAAKTTDKAVPTPAAHNGTEELTMEQKLAAALEKAKAGKEAQQ